MLVIISDLHLTDGTTGTTIPGGAFRDFQARLRHLATDASWHADGRYAPIDAFDLVLLGDVFDLLRTTRWSQEPADAAGAVRPWHDPAGAPFIARVQEIVAAILAHNEDACRAIRALSQEGGVAIPPATAAGRPDPAAAPRPVTVRVHYMSGNHDWMFHLPGPAYDRLRQDVNQALGLANPADPYPHEPGESPLLAEAFARHRVLARHGDIYDPFNYDREKGRNAASLGDAIVVELINRLPHEVRRRLADVLPAPLLDGLDELANVRPSLLVPVWIDGLLRRMSVAPAERRQVERVWDEMADSFLALPFIREKDTWSPIDLIDLMESTLRFSRDISINQAARLVALIREKLWGGESSFARHALTEDAFKNKSARHFVYGHTHHHEVVPLDTVQIQGQAFDQIYFNSGTWHPVHELTHHNRRQQQFVSFHVMTFLAFFRNGERGGRPFETWSGALGRRTHP